LPARFIRLIIILAADGIAGMEKVTSICAAKESPCYHRREEPAKLLGKELMPAKNSIRRTLK